MPGITWVEVDSTATAWMKTEGDKKPSKDAIEKAIRKGVRSLEKVTRKVPAAEYVVTLEGMA